jgi:DNA-binding GntR family transcriptional regulator
VARLAAARVTKTQAGELRRLAAAEATNVASYRALDSRFHLEVARCSRNDYAVEAIERARREFFVWADAVTQAPWSDMSRIARNSEAEHEAIAEAIASGDPDAAAGRMQAHLERGGRLFRRYVAGNA